MHPSVGQLQQLLFLISPKTIAVGALMLSGVSGLFTGFHIVKLQLSSPEIHIEELERRAQSYVEPMETTTALANVTRSPHDDLTGYIHGPSSLSVLWSKLRVPLINSQDPKYLAKIARTCGLPCRTIAVEILSRLHDMPEHIYRSTGQACDTQTLIALARHAGTDVHYFLLPRPHQYDQSVHLSQQLYQFLFQFAQQTKLSKCTQHYTEVLLGRIKPSLSQDDDNLDDYEDLELFSQNRPRKAELSPPIQSLASLTRSSLEVIWHLTMRKGQRAKFINMGGLQLLNRIWDIFSADEDIMCKMANILVNLSYDEENVNALVSGGFLHMLVTWIKSGNNHLCCTAGTALSNLDKPQYKPGTYLLHPLYSRTRAPEVDIVFIHGVNGGAFKTWRQHLELAGSEDYTSCWPKDWLGADFNVRVIGIDFSSNATYWETQCPYEKEKRTICSRAEDIVNKLERCSLGERPIIWVGHSLGGLIIKQILAHAHRTGKHGHILRQTEGVVFCGVPHKGSPVVDITTSGYSRFVVFPAIEMQELANKSRLVALNSDFVTVMEETGIRCINFIEDEKTSVPSANIKLHIVPKEYGELECGDNVQLAEDHISICKPRDRKDKLYCTLSELITQVTQNGAVACHVHAKRANVQNTDDHCFVL